MIKEFHIKKNKNIQISTPQTSKERSELQTKMKSSEELVGGMNESVESQVLNLIDFIGREMPEREIFIIYSRVGLYGPEKTLEELGELMGNITRERVRQIESRGLRMLKNAYESGLLKDTAIDKFKMYADKASFYSEIELENETYPKNCLLKILTNIFNDEYEIISNPKIGTDSILSHRKLELEKGITGLLKELSDTDNLIDLSDLSIKYKVPNHIIQGINGIVIHNGLVGLESNKKLFYTGVPGKIYATLKEAGYPMKIKEICDKAILSHNQVRGAIERIPDAVNVGLSTYALKEWGYIEGFISDVAVHYLKEANQPLSLKQLTSLILKQRVVKENSIYPQLSNDNRLTLLDNGYWALSGWGYENIHKKIYQQREYEIDAKEALMNILNENKEFMSLRQILKEISNKYGPRTSASWSTHYITIQKLKEIGDIIEMKKGRYSYYKSAIR